MVRSNSFTQAKADKICARIIGGESLRSICADEGMPPTSTVFLWLSKQPAFVDQYAHAKEAQAEAMLEEIIAIADDGLNDTYVDDEGNRRTDNDVVQRSKLRVDTRKWAMSKMAPKKYGEKVTQVLTGANGGPIEMIELRPVYPSNGRPGH